MNNILDNKSMSDEMKVFKIKEEMYTILYYLTMKDSLKWELCTNEYVSYPKFNPLSIYSFHIEWNGFIITIFGDTHDVKIFSIDKCNTITIENGIDLYDLICNKFVKIEYETIEE